MSKCTHRHKYWETFPSFEEAEKDWEEKALKAKAKQPIKNLKQLPKMVAMSEETRRFFRLKSFMYLLWHDTKGSLIRQLLKSPFENAYRYLRSIVRGKSYKRSEDFFFYGIESEERFLEIYQNDKEVPFLLGFSYCHKPFECPDGRFSDRCRADLENTTCRQCFIGKMVHFSPKRAQLVIIPTVHYIAQKVFEAKSASKTGRVFFLITACEMTLEMFGDWGNAVGLEGIGVRLDGRICNTMKAFELSEKGVKPGLTVVTNPTQERMLDLIQKFY